MGSEHNHINPTEGIEDVELEDDEVDETSFEELVKQRRESTREALQDYREAVGTTDAGDDPSDVEKDDERSAGQPAESVTVDSPTTDGEIIKRTGIAHMGVDVENEDDESMRELIKDAREGEVEIGLSEESSGDAAFDAIQKGTSSVRERFDRDVPMSQLEASEQAATLAKEAAEDVDVDALVDEAADLPKSPSAVREQVFEKVYSDITKFVRTIYSETEIDREVLKTVREKIATDAARRALVARKANEDGMETMGEDTEKEVEEPEEGGDQIIGDEGHDGGDTDAPKTEGDSEDVDLTGDDLDLEG